MTEESTRTKSVLLWLGDEDRAAARRLLAMMSEEGGRSTRRDQKATRSKQLERARLQLYLCQRRVEVLGEVFASEPAFLIALALYCVEDRDPALSITKLVALTEVTPTTVLRWVEILLTEGWLERRSTSPNKKRTRIALTNSARVKMDDLFSWPD